MNYILLILAAALAFLIGVAHSYLGERYILIRLFRRENLPMLFGSTDFTVRTLRFAWHLTTVCWWAFALILIGIALPEPISTESVRVIIGGTFLLHSLVALFASRGRHLAWIVFLLIGVFALFPF
jgi:hypothetical protein